MEHTILHVKNQLKQGKDKLRFQLRRCLECGSYTLKDNCTKCEHSTKSVHPAKFSPDDKYLRYRIAEK
mgnify:CR=1 FL=1